MQAFRHDCVSYDAVQAEILGLPNGLELRLANQFYDIIVNGSIYPSYGVALQTRCVNRVLSN